MKVITGVEEFTHKTDHVVVALGNFDGVHLGHQFIFRNLVEKSRHKNGSSVVFSFDPHPLKILQKDHTPLLLTGTEVKKEIIGSFGVDYLLLYPFTLAIAQMSPRLFIEEILIKGLGSKHVFVGFNFTFGKKAEGTPEIMQQICLEHGCLVTVIPPVKLDGECVSSTRIRECLVNGDINEANRLLGYPYSITGTVVAGDQFGRQMGFPTANLTTLPDKAIPANGVYAVKVLIEEKTFDGAANIGHRPTIGEGLPRSIEIHIFDQNINLYEKRLRVFFIECLRREKKFSCKEDLMAQIKKDTSQAKIVLKAAESINFNGPLVKA